MQCTSPIQGWRSIEGGITQTKAKAYGDLPLTVRCGRCIGCRLERARVWAVRCVHESTLHDENIFATLTYNDENLPYGETLDRRHVQLFFKKLRKRVPHARFFYAGEYGETTKRPHYHALIFNWRPNDAELHARRGGNSYYTSQKLDALWGMGLCDFSEVTFTSAAYTAGYITKKIGGDPAQEHYQWTDESTGEIRQRTPEFQGQSLCPGIGYNWIKNNLLDVYSKDQIILDGIPSRPPRYYDQVCEKLNPDLWKQVRQKRAKENLKPPSDPYHGTSRQMFAKNKINKQKQTKRDLK
ncbi:replication initiator protein [Microviridae sp.]|nr:replication initiator protein [Microviridae sp.]